MTTPWQAKKQLKMAGEWQPGDSLSQATPVHVAPPPETEVVTKKRKKKAKKKVAK